jgi:membrane protease YdiL (CAAX protease family)
VTSPHKARGLIAIVVATIGFSLALALRAHVDPWRSTALAALVSIGLSAWALVPRMRELFGVTFRGAALAIGLGALLVAATHVAYHAVQLASPALAESIRVLYASIDVGASRLTLLVLTTTVVLGEELVWRGVAIELVGGAGRSRVAIGAASVAAYVLPQLAAHVVLLVLAATGLGSLFAAQRIMTGRLTEPFLTHLVWSLSVFVLFPLA